MITKKTIILTRIISLTLGILSLTALVLIDNAIATRYNQADGKTRALFGIVVLLQFQYRYLILIPAVLSIFLASRLIWIREFKIIDIGTLIIGLLSIAGLTASSWKLMI